MKKWTAGTLTYTTGSVALLFVWLLLGDFSWSMRDRSVGPMAQWYLNHLMVPSVVFGLLVSSFPALLQLIVAPWISTKSDRHRSARGRRIPFLLWTTPIAALGMIGLGVTPLLAQWLHEVCNSGALGQWLHAHLDNLPWGAWLLRMLSSEMVVSVTCFGIFWTAFEVASIAGKPIFDGLINDVVPRPLLGRFYGLFRAVSLIDGMIFNYWIMGYVPTHFAVIMISVGIFYAAAFVWVCFRVREGEYPEPEIIPAIEGTSGGLMQEVRHYCRECFSHSYYLSVFVMLMAASLCFGPVNIFAIPYAKYMGVSMDLYGKTVAFTFFISLCLTYLLGWLADRFHPLRLAIAILFVYAVICIFGSFWVNNSTTFLIAWVLHGVVSGTYFTGAASLALRLFPHEKFAQFASAGAIFGALANMVMAPVVGRMIDASGSVYRYTFVAGFAFTVLALLCGLRVYRQFRKFGGPDHYVAPDYR